MEKYSINQVSIETLLVWVNSEEIAIPEIQRPFVWHSSKVRDFIDSLYQGYPVGYIIDWKNPDIRLKDGNLSVGKKILIDGQQRITALTTAILGKDVVDKNYKKVKIRIAFNPIEETFEVQNPAILKDKSWFHNIADAFNSDDLFDVVDTYCQNNPNEDKKHIRSAFTKLNNISNKQIGIIELSHDLDIETVTEIFIRINSKGEALSQADFVMSKIASDTEYGGNELRKTIDYFCHLAVSPEFFQDIESNDKDFSQTDFFSKIKWLKEEKEDLYDPNYKDLIRVAFTSQFNRGKLSDLVSLLSGRNFEARTFEEEIVKKSFATLKSGVLNFVNETNFKRFLMIIKSAGFISSKLVRSQSALNFAYIIYLKLKELKIDNVDIEKFVKKWYVYTILTGRYSGSSESNFDFDIKQISNKFFKKVLEEREEAELSDAYWNASLIQSFDTSVASSPYFDVFLASQVKSNDKGFLSKDISLRDLILLKGDIHHLFPKSYLKKKGLKQNKYNQIANYVYMQSEINIKVGDNSPKEYFSILKQQLEDGEKNRIIGISSEEELLANLKMHCIPPEIQRMDSVDDYEEFLQLRRKLMAEKLKNYYFNL